MFCLEWNAFQFLILMAGYIDNDHLAAQVIIYNICFICFIIAYGISMAASTLVGNSIGAGNVPLAKKYAKIILIGSAFINFLVAGVLYLARVQVTMAYVAEHDGGEEVTKLTIETLPFLCLHLVFDLF